MSSPNAVSGAAPGVTADPRVRKPARARRSRPSSSRLGGAVGSAIPGGSFASPAAAVAQPKIRAGGVHTCALSSAGTVKCWGRNVFGQLGDGSTDNSAVPVGVTNLTGVTSIATGGAHSCALLANGTVRCWGLNFYGQLGNGTTTNSSTPVAVSGLSGVSNITTGDSHTCALMTITQ